MRQFSLSFSSIEAKNHKIDTEKHDNIDNEDNNPFIPSQKMLSKVVLRCCLKEARQQRQRFFLTQKMLFSVVVNKKKVYQQSERQYDTP